MPGTERSLAALAACAAAATACPIALISASEGTRHRIVAAHGLELGSADPPAPSFCREALQAGTAFVVEDTLREPRLAEDAMVTGPPRVRFCAGEPLRRDGEILGTLCVLDSRPRTLPDHEADALRGLASAIAEVLHERRRDPELESERRRLLDFARASGDWMWEIDAALRYTWIAGAFEAVTGLVPSTEIGQPADDGVLLDAQGQPARGTFLDLLQAGRPFSRVLTEKATPRGPRVVSRSAVPVYDARGALSGWRGTARDVTEPIARAREQRAQDELLQQLCDQAPGVIFQLREDSAGTRRFEFVSERSVDLFGLTPAQLIADISCLAQRVHPDDLERLRRSYAHRSRNGGPVQQEYRVLRPDAGERWMASTASPEPRSDGSTVWRGFVADITEQKQIALALRASEERWEIAAETNGIGIARLDLASGRVMFDARACANHGIAYPHPPYLLADWIAAVHPEDRAGAEAALEAAVRRTGRLDARYRFMRADGTVPWLEVIARVEQQGPGAPTSMIGTCRDVTEQVAIDSLRREKDTIERASRAKSDFLSRVSHELRTPLNGILGFAQLMALDRDHPLAAEQQLRLDGVQRSGEHLLALINDVLDIARIEQDDFQPRLEPVNLVDTVGTCLAMIQPLASSRGVVLTDRLPGFVWVAADARALEQVLINLLSNAIKFNRAGGHVLIEAETRGDRVALSVEDEGSGLDAAQQAQLFQPFNRLGAERRRVEGNGLGLVISRQLARAMKGELTLASRAGRGCRFTLELPGAAPLEDLTPTVPSSFDSLPAAHGAQRQVLYIEDEPLNVLLMQEVFRRNDQWMLHTARDGAEGLRMARALLPDLLLIDINLPDMTGIAIVRELRGAAPTAELHCIALSADAMSEQIDAARAAGFDDYWTKPIDVAHLTKALAGSFARGRVAAS